MAYDMFWCEPPPEMVAAHESAERRYDVAVASHDGGEATQGDVDAAFAEMVRQNYYFCLSLGRIDGTLRLARRLLKKALSSRRSGS